LKERGGTQNAKTAKMEQQAAPRQEQQQQDDGSRLSFTTFWKRSKDALTPRKITFVQQQQQTAGTGAGSGTGTGAGFSGTDNGEGECFFLPVLLPTSTMDTLIV
jgi:hypothetical protein